MTKFHINDKGEVKECKAQSGNCPITKDNYEKHYDTKEEAQSAYEHIMKNNKFSSILNMSKMQSIWFNKLNDNELNALSFYGQPFGHRKLNERLRNNSITEQDMEIVSNLDSALFKSDKGILQKVYRGMILDKKEFDKIINNNEIHNKGYSSVSSSHNVAANFTKDVFDDGNFKKTVLIFHSDRASYLDIGEKEILLPRDLSLNIDKHEHSNNIDYLYCSYKKE